MVYVSLFALLPNACITGVGMPFAHIWNETPLQYPQQTTANKKRCAAGQEELKTRN